ncbi:MAG: polysaccharide pyruvyl transferase family protein [Ruminococcaceae bacterium]|nr:polysaccharide pyruvyl transferase family protein [Oscillospiraceae bacterium]
MSKNLFLCGHTGSDNRGCEAIVRSTVKLFKEAGLKNKPALATSGVSQDKAAGVNELCEFISYNTYKSSLQRYFYAGVRKVSSNPIPGQNIIQKDLWKAIKPSDLSLAIGGDTYCYKGPTVFIAHNKKMEKKAVPSVLWCCSIGKEYITKNVLEDLKRYTYIVAREPYTYDALVESGIEKEKILRCCDPAFMLERKECPLPEGFEEGNTVGLNISPLVKNEEVYRAVEFLIEKIIKDTDMKICLVPHVYNAVPTESGDLKLLREFYNKYLDTGRISIVDKNYTCEELKFIISKCRFFVGARTHSTIAAYSTMVPTLVLGYSIKSLGIAKELFGTEKGYVLPYTDIKEEDYIYNAFADIMKNEREIKEHFKKVLPDYTKTVKDVVDTLYSKYLGD